MFGKNKDSSRKPADGNHFDQVVKIGQISAQTKSINEQTSDVIKAAHYDDESALLVLVIRINCIADENLKFIAKAHHSDITRGILKNTQSILENALTLLTVCLDHDARNDTDYRRLEAQTYINLASVNIELGGVVKPYFKQAENALKNIPDSVRIDHDRTDMALCANKKKARLDRKLFSAPDKIIPVSEKPEVDKRLKG